MRSPSGSANAVWVGTLLGVLVTWWVALGWLLAGGIGKSVDGAPGAFRVGSDALEAVR